MFVSIARGLLVLLGALALSAAARAQPALGKATLTGDVTSLTCIITTYDGTPRSQAVPCDVSGTTFTLAPNQSLGVSVAFTYDYRDDGGSFAGGVVGDCTFGPCIVDPDAAYEYGQLWGVFTFCESGGQCGERAYPISILMTDGADDRMGQDSAYEILYPTLTNTRTVTVSFDLETATFSAVTPVPEPSTWALLGVGMLAIQLASRRRRVA
jgi:hypothetical protein